MYLHSVSGHLPPNQSRPENYPQGQHPPKDNYHPKITLEDIYPLPLKISPYDNYPPPWKITTFKVHPW